MKYIVRLTRTKTEFVTLYVDGIDMIGAIKAAEELCESTNYEWTPSASGDAGITVDMIERAGS